MIRIDIMCIKSNLNFCCVDTGPALAPAPLASWMSMPDVSFEKGNGKENQETREDKRQ